MENITQNGVFVKKKSGRPFGSTNKAAELKRKIQDYITEEQVRDLIKIMLLQATEKPVYVTYILDQIFGKARQNIGLDGGEGKELVIHLSEAIASKNAVQAQTTPAVEAPVKTLVDVPFSNVSKVAQ